MKGNEIFQVLGVEKSIRASYSQLRQDKIMDKENTGVLHKKRETFVSPHTIMGRKAVVKIIIVKGIIKVYPVFYCWCFFSVQQSISSEENNVESMEVVGEAGDSSEFASF